MVRVFQNPNFSSLSSSLQFGNNSAQLSQSQVQHDGLLESAKHQASDWRALAAMSIGSTAFTLTRSVSHALLANFFRSSSLLSGFSWGSALLGEVAAFRASNQAFNEAGHAESWNDGRAFLGTTLDFILLKGFSHYLHGESFVTRHGVSASAMVAGELARESTGLSDATQKDLSERFVHAAVTSVALELGSQLSQRATGGRLHAFERNMKGRLESELSGHSERHQQSPHETGERLFAMRSSEPLSERRFQIEGRNIVLRIEGEVSENRARELQEQITQALQGELVLELEGIVTIERFSANQAKIFNFMSGRETQITITSSGEVRNIRITKDGREVFRLGEAAASSTAHPAAPAARVSAAEATRPVVLAEPFRTIEAERPVERAEDPAWARLTIDQALRALDDSLSIRTCTALENAGIRTLGQLVRCDETALLSTEAVWARGGTAHIHPRDLRILKAFLAKHHLALAMSDAEIAAIPDLSTPREVISGSDGKNTVRIVQAHQVERIEEPAAAAALSPVIEIPVALVSDRISQGNIFTLNGLFSDLMAAQPEWAGVQEAARALISTSGTSDSVGNQRAKTEALVHFLQNAARFAGPADVLELISRIKRGDAVLNVRKFAGALMAAAEKRRATQRASVEAVATEAIQTETEAADLQAPPAPDAVASDVRVEQDGSAENRRRDEGRQDNQGDHERGERDEGDAEEAPSAIADASSTPGRALSDRITTIRELMDRLCTENTAKLGNHSAAAHKSAQSRALRSIENANIPDAQKFFLLEQFEQNLGTEGGLERVRLLREKIESRPETVKALDGLSRRTTWVFAYERANVVYHKILLLNAEAYEAVMPRFHELVSNLKSPSSSTGLGKMPLFNALKRLERDLERTSPAREKVTEVKSLQELQANLYDVAEEARTLARQRSDYLQNSLHLLLTLLDKIGERLSLGEVEDILIKSRNAIQILNALREFRVGGDFTNAERRLGDIFNSASTQIRRERQIDVKDAISEAMFGAYIDQYMSDRIPIVDVPALIRDLDHFVYAYGVSLRQHQEAVAGRSPAAGETGVASGKLDAPGTSEVGSESPTRMANRSLIGRLPEALRGRAEEILKLIDRTYEIDHVRKNPSLIVDAGQTLPEKEGAIRFAIARKKGRVDLNVKSSLEACKGLPELAAGIILEKQREVIEGKIEAYELTKIRERVTNSAALNAHVKHFEARTAENAAEWRPVSERLERVYRRVILESEKAYFDRTRGRLARRLEALQSSSAPEIAQALQELCDAENIDRVLRGTPAGGEAERVEVTPEATSPEAAAPVMDVGPVAEEAAAEPAPHVASPEPAPEAVVIHAPVDRETAPAREVRRLSERHQTLCERLPRPYSQTMRSELENLLNAGESWAAVFEISIRIVERITSGERIALPPHVAASRLFLSLRKRSKSSPEAIQGELEKLDNDLTPPSGPEGSDGGSDTPPSPPPSPPPAETLVEREEVHHDEKSADPAAVNDVASEAAVPEVIREAGEAEISAEAVTATSEAPLVHEASEHNEILKRALDIVASDIAELIPQANRFKGLWKRLVSRATDLGTEIENCEGATLGQRSEALRQVHALLEPVMANEVRDPQVTINQIEALQNQFRTHPERFSAATPQRILNPEIVRAIRRAVDEIHQNPEALSGNDYYKGKIREGSEAILTYLESDKGPEDASHALDLVQKVLGLRTLDADIYDARTISMHLDHLERALKQKDATKLQELSESIEAYYQTNHSAEVAAPIFYADLSRKRISRLMRGEAAPTENYPDDVRALDRHFEGASHEGLCFFYGLSTELRDQCLDFYRSSPQLVRDAAFMQRAITFFSLVQRMYLRNETPLIRDAEIYQNLEAAIRSDFIERHEARIASTPTELARVDEVDPLHPSGETPIDVAPSGVDGEILRRLTLTGEARLAYDRLSPKAKQGLAILVRAAKKNAIPSSLEELFYHPEALDLREGAYLNTLFETFCQMTSLAVRGGHTYFAARNDIERALRAETGIDIRSRLEAVLSEWEVAIVYARRHNRECIRLAEEYKIDWTRLTEAQKKYLRRLDPDMNLDLEVETARPDLRFCTKSRSSYLIEVKNTAAATFNPGSAARLQMFKQAFRYALVRAINPDHRISHVEFVIRANQIDAAFINEFREACEMAKLPFVLCKFQAARGLEVVDASFEFELSHFKNGVEFDRARRAQTSKPADQTPEPVSAAIAEKDPIPSSPVARTSTPPATAAVEDSAALARTTRTSEAPEAAEELAETKIRISPGIADFINSHLIELSFFEHGDPRLNPKSDFLSNYQTFRRASRSRSIESVDRKLGEYMQSAEFKALPEPVRERIVMLKEEVNRTSKTGTHNVSQRFFKQLLEIASLVTDPASFTPDTSNSARARLTSALNVFITNPRLMTEALNKMQANLDVIQEHPVDFSLKDLEEDSPDRPFAVDIVGEAITLRQVQKELQGNGELIGRMGTEVYDKILKYIVQYEKLHAQLSSQAQRQSAAPTNAGAEI